MLDTLRQLVRLEHDEAVESERLHRIDAEVAELRERAASVSRFFVEEREVDRRLRAAEDEARAEAERRDAEVAAAEQELAGATNEDERALAEQQLARALGHVEVAARDAQRAAEDRAAFEREVDALTRELPLLEQRAGELASEIPGAPAPDEALDDWASRAHAALFVAAGQVDARRDRAIREANELASSLLGESTHGSTPAQALARVERHWTSSPGQVSDRR
jgi:chromosome segregation ATPase